MAEQNIYTVGGTVQAGEGLYICRQADEELLVLSRSGTFAYVLTARQMGKSSLMVHTAERLADEGIRSAIVDLTELGVQLTAEEWYLGLLIRISYRLRLKASVVEWWQNHDYLGIAQRLGLFFQEILLAEIEVPVVIFVDEIDSTLSLGFTDDFFAAIRYLYNARALAPELGRLSFVLLGVAEPGSLINDPKRTPFNIGRRVDLTDFVFEEAKPLAEGLGMPLGEARQVLRWILKWTGGHPYLTQRLCSFIAKQNWNGCTKADVESAVATIFYGEMSERDNNLQFVRDMLTKRAPDPTGVLATYRDIRRGRYPVRDEEQSLVKSHLKLSGIVRREKGVLRVRNPIYGHVFDLRWIREHWPVNWWAIIPREVKIAAGIIAAMFAALVLVTVFALRQQQRAERQAQIAISRLLAVQARDVLENQLDLALLLSIEANRRGNTIDVRGSLVDGLLHSPHLITFLRGHTKPVESVAFSPDGQILASGSANGRIILWDMTTRRPFAYLVGDSRFVTSIAFSPDARVLAAANADGTVMLWDIATRQAIGIPLDKHNGPVNCVAFSPDGRILASGGSDSTVRLWDTATREPLGEPLGHSDPVDSLAFSPDGTALLTGTRWSASIVLWDIDTQQQIGAIPQAHKNSVTSVAFSPDGRTIASGSKDKEIVLWDAVSRQPLGKPLTNHTNWVFSIAFSPDGKTLASGSWDNTIILWDVETQQPVGQPLTGHTNNVLEVAFSPDGETLASGSRDNTIILWDVKARQPLINHRDTIWDVTFSPDGKMLASASQDGSILLWDVASQKQFASLIGHGAEVNSIAFSSDGKKLASGSGDQNIAVWDVEIGQQLEILSSGTGVVWSVAFSPNDKILASGSEDGSISLWDATTYQPLGTPLKGHSERVLSVAFSPDGKTLASGGQDGTIRLWSVAGRESLGEPLTELDRVETVVFSPDGRMLASGSHDKTIRLWNVEDVQNPYPIGLPLIGHTDWVLGVDFSPDGQVLASASADRTIRLWDVATRRPLSQPLSGHADRVWSIAFSPNGRLVVTGSEDKSVIFWDLDNLLNASIKELQARACSIVNRNLIQAEWEQFIGPDNPYQLTCTDLH